MGAGEEDGREQKKSRDVPVSSSASPMARIRGVLRIVIRVLAPRLPIPHLGREGVSLGRGLLILTVRPVIS